MFYNFHFFPKSWHHRARPKPSSSTSDPSFSGNAGGVWFWIWKVKLLFSKPVVPEVDQFQIWILGPSHHVPSQPLFNFSIQNIEEGTHHLEHFNSHEKKITSEQSSETTLRRLRPQPSQFPQPTCSFRSKWAGEADWPQPTQIPVVMCHINQQDPLTTPSQTPTHKKKRRKLSHFSFSVSSVSLSSTL